MTEVKNKKKMVHLFYIFKLEKKRTLEKKKHSPEVKSNHNEEHITNPCGFVTHIIYTNNKTLDGFFNISKLCQFYQAVISRQNMILT